VLGRYAESYGGPLPGALVERLRGAGAGVAGEASVRPGTGFSLLD
jgi:hypothetical protein